MSDFERELGAALRRGEQGLGSPALARIAQARNAALAAERPSLLQRLFAPTVGAAVLATALGIALLLPLQQQLSDPGSSANAQPNENPELYQDLDFYLWLAESDMGRHG